MNIVRNTLTEYISRLRNSDVGNTPERNSLIGNPSSNINDYRWAISNINISFNDRKSF